MIGTKSPVSRGSLSLRLLAGLIMLAVAFDAAAAAEKNEESRRVLAIFSADATENGDPAKANIHQFLEKPINHYGLMLEYHNVNLPLPDVEKYRGIIVWLSSYEMENPERLIPWLMDALDRGVRIVMPAGIQAPYSSDGRRVDYAEVTAFLRAFGLAASEYLNLGADLSKVQLHTPNPTRFEFETNLTNLTTLSPIVWPLDDRLDVWQTVESKENPDQRGATVVCGNTGAWAISESVLYYSLDLPGEEYRVAWNIDPFRFVRKALGCLDLPAIDVTTFAGTRGAYSHVDADGPYNLTTDFPGPPRYAYDVIYDNVFSVYAFPITVGYIACDYDPDIDLRFIESGETAEEALKRPRRDWQADQADIARDMRATAAKIAALPNIQSGCHSYSHPLNWRDREPGYAIRGYEVTYENEIRMAVEYLNANILPPDKPVELYQWSGDCDPPDEAFTILDDMGLLNINGGDPLYDGKFSSVFFVCPLTRPKGEHLQVHTSGSNENIYTHGWTAFRGAFNNVIATFENSDSPRRLLPVNIYYHIFPAECQAGLQAIRNAYEWAMDQELCWMKATDYVKAVLGFAKARLGRTGDGGWWLEDYGQVPSLRFEDETRRVDMAASINVAGYNYHGGSLYVSLLPGERAEIRLTDDTPTLPSLAGSSGLVRAVQSTPDSWSGEVCVWNDGFIDLRDANKGWKASFTVPGEKTEQGTLEPLSDNRLRLELPRSDGAWVNVLFERE